MSAIVAQHRAAAGGGRNNGRASPTPAAVSSEPPQLYKLVLAKQWPRVLDRLDEQGDPSAREEAQFLDDFGLSALHRACYRDAPVDVVQALVAAYPQATALQDECDFSGLTPLHAACHYCSKDVVQALLEANFTVLQRRNRKGQTPLDCTCQVYEARIRHHIDRITQELRELEQQGGSGAVEPDSDSDPPAALPSYSSIFDEDPILVRFWEVASLLLRAQVSPRCSDIPIVHACAAAAGTVPLIMLELALKLCPDQATLLYREDYPLHAALRFQSPSPSLRHTRHIKVLQLLLQHNTSLAGRRSPKDNLFPFQLAVSQAGLTWNRHDGDCFVERLLLLNPAAFYSLGYSDQITVDALAKAGCNPNEMTLNGVPLGVSKFGKKTTHRPSRPRSNSLVRRGILSNTTSSASTSAANVYASILQAQPDPTSTASAAAGTATGTGVAVAGTATGTPTSSTATTAPSNTSSGNSKVNMMELQSLSLVYGLLRQNPALMQHVADEQSPQPSEEHQVMLAYVNGVYAGTRTRSAAPRRVLSTSCHGCGYTLPTATIEGSRGLVKSCHGRVTAGSYHPEFAAVPHCNKAKKLFGSKKLKKLKNFFMHGNTKHESSASAILATGQHQTMINSTSDHGIAGMNVKNNNIICDCSSNHKRRCAGLIPGHHHRHELDDSLSRRLLSGKRASRICTDPGCRRCMGRFIG